LKQKIKEYKSLLGWIDIYKYIYLIYIKIFFDKII
jgi:hypothetical protein